MIETHIFHTKNQLTLTRLFIFLNVEKGKDDKIMAHNFSLDYPIDIKKCNTSTWSENLKCSEICKLKSKSLHSFLSTPIHSPQRQSLFFFKHVWNSSFKA